jgi:[protein-PII] uridylyltransferase
MRARGGRAEPGAEAASRSTSKDLVGPSPAFIDAYVDSMPGEYLRLFDDAAIEAHAGIVQRRGPAATRLEAWKQLSDGVVAICVVADDVIGLLSRVCAAIFAHGADVIAAQAYSRVRYDCVMEAVDLLWIRRAEDSTGPMGPLRPHDTARIGATLDSLVRGKPNLQRTVRLLRAVRAAGGTTTIDFESDERGSTLLTVHTDDRPGLLLAITRALFGERVQILSSHAETQGHRAIDRFWVAELNGSPLNSERQLTLQAVVLEAIDGKPT